MLEPRDRFGEVRASHDIDVSIAVDIHRGISKVFVIMRVGTSGHLADLVLFPIRSGIPGVSAEDIELAIVVEVRHSDGFERGHRIDVVLFPLNSRFLGDANCTSTCKELHDKNGFRDSRLQGEYSEGRCVGKRGT